MPQMSPLMWLILFLFFSIMYIMSMIKTYYASPSSTPSKSISTQENKIFIKKMNWKW